jgi:8-oxo-dGTP pyrophosphatase MutT (NUDIX family)
MGVSMQTIDGTEQYAALPYRRRADGSIEILLVTSRGSGRWIIPKGWPAPGMTPCESAAREAMEEGGVVGRIRDAVIGSYPHTKTLRDGSSICCVVNVFALEVESQMRDWPESGQRSARWFAVEEAVAMVREPELKATIWELSASVAKSAGAS